MYEDDIVDIYQQFKEYTNTDMDFLYNDIQHQKKDTECGIYCIHFITSIINFIHFLLLLQITHIVQITF